MEFQGDKFVCGGCGAWFIPGVAPASSTRRAR
jgi:hypothetical protein